MLQMVFNLDKPALQLTKVCICFQLRIVLGNHNEAHHAVGNSRFGTGLVRQMLSSFALRSQLRDRFERGLFVVSVCPHRRHQARQQVVPALQLDVDVRPGVFDPITVTHQTVVDDNCPDEQRKYGAKAKPFNHRYMISLRTRADNRRGFTRHVRLLRCLRE